MMFTVNCTRTCFYVQLYFETFPMWGNIRRPTQSFATCKRRNKRRWPGKLLSERSFFLRVHHRAEPPQREIVSPPPVHCSYSATAFCVCVYFFLPSFFSRMDAACQSRIWEKGYIRIANE